MWHSLCKEYTEFQLGVVKWSTTTNNGIGAQLPFGEDKECLEEAEVEVEEEDLHLMTDLGGYVVV